MNWLDALRDSGLQARADRFAPAVSTLPARKRELKSFWATVRNPDRNRPGDAGEVEAVFYLFDGREVTLADENGKPRSNKAMAVGPETNPKQIAAILWRSTRDGSDFNRRISYQPLGIV